MYRVFKLNQVILASGSPRRADLLRQIRISFDIMPSTEYEPLPENQIPEDYVVETARLKGESVRKKLNLYFHEFERFVLAADTIVSVDGEVLGKPRDTKDACCMLRRLMNSIIKTCALCAFIVLFDDLVVMARVPHPIPSRTRS